MHAGLTTRIFAGFLAILFTFSGGALLAVQRMHAIREDLLLIHRGYLAMTRLATQVRTLQEAKDDYVARALAEPTHAVRRQLVGYAREFYPKALRDRLEEIRGITSELSRGQLRADDAAFLSSVVDHLDRARDLNEAYDEATVRVLESVEHDPREARDQAVVADPLVEYRQRSDDFSRELRALYVAMEAKIND